MNFYQHMIQKAGYKQLVGYPGLKPGKQLLKKALFFNGPFSTYGLRHIVEEFTKGFFPVSIADAFIAAGISLAGGLIPEHINPSDSFVFGSVNDSTANYTLAYGTEAQYNQIKSQITNSTSDQYSLIFYNGQHWASDNFL